MKGANINNELKQKLKEVKNEYPVGSIIPHKQGDIKVRSLKSFNAVYYCEGLNVGVCYNRFYVYMGTAKNKFKLERTF